MNQMQAAAAGGATDQGLESLLGSYQSAVPGLNRPKMDNRLEGSLDALIPDGMNRSPLFQPEMMAPEEAGPLTPKQVHALSDEPESVQQISMDASTLAEQGVDLHSARMRIMSTLRAMGYRDKVLQEAYNLIGQIYSSAAPAPGGGDRSAMLNAPLNYLKPKYQNAGGTIEAGLR
jgi:hypothetical protein